VPAAPLPPELQRFVAKARPAVVGTVRADGAPVTTACWYMLDGQGRVVLSMDRESHRLRHIRGNPRVALTVLGDSWYNHVSVLGRAVAFREDDDLADIDALAQHYEGEAYDDRGYRGTTVTVEIDSWHTWGDPAAEG
jgi:PPOX class probable F420-dependent enzyme